VVYLSCEREQEEVLMSGYASQREVREVIVATLRAEGRDERDYSVAGIARDAFYYRGAGYGYGANSEAEFREAVARHARKRVAR
jgi:hypothetical protein